jgi:hypothetical protein
MYSHLSELVKFTKEVNPIMNDIARPVEEWLKEVE